MLAVICWISKKIHKYQINVSRNSSLGPIWESREGWRFRATLTYMALHFHEWVVYFWKPSEDWSSAQMESEIDLSTKKDEESTKKSILDLILSCIAAP